MDDRTAIATEMLAALLGNGSPHMLNPTNRPAIDAPRYGATYSRLAVAWADVLLAELRKGEPQEEGGDPWEREKAAAAAIEDDKPF